MSLSEVLRCTLRERKVFREIIPDDFTKMSPDGDNNVFFSSLSDVDEIRLDVKRQVFKDGVSSTVEVEDVGGFFRKYDVSTRTLYLSPVNLALEFAIDKIAVPRSQAAYESASADVRTMYDLSRMIKSLGAWSSYNLGSITRLYLVSSAR
jgi:hypothetical protein